MRIRSAFGLAAAAGMAVSSTAVGQFNMVTNISGTFTDISGTGTIITSGDDSSAAFTSGVTNAAWANASAFASTNGNITNISNGTYTNSALPWAAVTSGLFPHWDDLYVDGPGTLKHQLVTEGGVPVEIIQWNQVRTFDGGAGSGTGTFEVKIFGGAGGPGGALVQFIYSNVAFIPGHENGSSATIGWQQSPSSFGQFSFNTASIQNGTVISIVPLSNDPGACCLGNGTCSFVSQTACINAGGTFTSIGTTCAQANCPAAGRCCTPTGCQSLTPAGCTAVGGVFTANTTCSAGCPASSYAHVMDILSTPQRMIVFAPAAPNFSSVTGPNGNFFGFAMDFDGTGNTLYGITYNNGATPCTFGTIDKVTGVFTAIGGISGAAAGEANIAGLTYDTTNNTMYCQGVAAQGVNNIYTVNLATGATTLVGPMTEPTALFIDTAVNTAGNMYSHDIVTDMLYTVNKATGATTVIGPTGQAANFAQGMDFDPIPGGLLYATMYTAASGPYATFDLTTGAATVILANTGNGEYEIAIRRQPATGGTCYANCDNSTTPPILNVLDFNCFLNQFSAGASYANCDGSTTPPILNVLDFNCFLNAFSVGCP